MIVVQCWCICKNELSLSFRSAYADFFFYKSCNVFHTYCSVFLRIETVRILCKVFFHTVAVCDTKFCSEVYFTDTKLDRFAYCVVRYAGSSVEYKRNRYNFADCLAVLVILNAYVEKYSVGLCVLSGGIALVGVYFAILHIIALTKMK